MGRIATFSDEQIIKAGKAIEAEGNTVSPFAIRNKLNGGSFNRIKDVWVNYNNQLTELQNEASTEEIIELPSEIQEALDKNCKSTLNFLEKLTSESYRVAQQLAEKRVKSTIEDYQTKVDELKDSERQADIAIEESDKKVENLLDELESLQTQNENLQVENSRLSGIIDMLTKRVEQLEATEVCYTKLQRDYGKLEGKFDLLNSSDLKKS